MIDKPVSPLRQRMIDDMTARRVKEKVQKDGSVANLAGGGIPGIWTPVG